jgi:hypothetical protein
VAVGRNDEASGHVVADQRERRGVAAVAHRQGAAIAGGVPGVGKRRLRTERDVRQVDAALWESLRWPERHAAPIRNCRIEDLNIPLAVRRCAEILRRIASDTIVENDLGGARQIVGRGGLAVGTIVKGDQDVASGGTTSATAAE